LIRAERTIAKLKSSDRVKIVALGDSLTQGRMARKGHTVFLDEMLHEKYPEGRFELINKGIPGDTALGGLDRLRADVLDLNPDCILVQFALNDGFSDVPVEIFGNTVQAIIDNIKGDSESDIVLVTSVYMDLKKVYQLACEYYGKLEALADKNSLPIAKVHEYWASKIKGEGLEFRKLVQGDLVHPTVEGYKLMAEAVMKVF
jgi:lysophospholipase L1-like esterase